MDIEAGLSLSGFKKEVLAALGKINHAEVRQILVSIEEIRE
ncbi:hypothetical protein [Paenibacillus humicus]